MSNRAYTKRNSAVQQDEGPTHNPFRCCADGCFLRAEVYPEQMGISDFARGYCGWHMAAKTADRSERSVSERIRKYRDLIGSFVRLRDAQLFLVGDKIRPAMTDYSQQNKPLVAMPYPERLPVKPDESHHDWIDRARAYLITLIVERSDRTPKPGMLQQAVAASTRARAFGEDY